MEILSNSDKILEIWMMIVGISMALSGVPQIIRLLKRKQSDDISIWMWLLVLNGDIWWVIYGIYKWKESHAISLIVTNIIFTVTGVILIFLTVKYRKRVAK